MEEPTYNFQDKTNLSDSKILSELHSQDVSPLKEQKEDSSDDDSGPVARIKKRVHQFSDSDTEKENKSIKENIDESGSSESEHGHKPHKNGLAKSRIQFNNSSDSDSSRQETIKNEEQQMRMMNKRNKLKQKFKGLLSSRLQSTQNESDKQSSEDDKNKNSSSETSDNEMSSIIKIKQKIRNSMGGIPSICDPDTSDDDDKVKQPISKYKRKKEQKSAKMIEAKPMRMSAKQAMENMQMIKSESNRMLREKAVSLPYHRPKALSLKDIMARRKPAVTSDGKVLPIKMNEEQLKQYALQLEQRQKEMMELCKSESEDDDNAESEIGTYEEMPVPNESDKKEIETDNKMAKTNSEQNEIDNVITNIDNNENDIASGSDTVSLKDKDVVIPVEDTNISVSSETNQNDSNTDMKLVYENSIEEDNVAVEKNEVNNESESMNETSNNNIDAPAELLKLCSEQDSQLISLHYTENTEEVKDTNDTTSDKEAEVTKEIPPSHVDSEILPQIEPSHANSEEDSAELHVNSDIKELNTVSEEIDNINEKSGEGTKINENSELMDITEDEKQDDFFSDDDVNMEDLDKIIENAEIMKDADYINSPMLIKDPINIKPKIMGAPGMVIDLDGMDAAMPKRTGVDLLKERFTYFSKLKTPEELEREREKKLKPGAQHLKLRQELENQIAEQRSLEWAKRLEEEKKLHQEMDSILDDADEADDSIEKIKGDVEEKDGISSASEEEEELLEDDVEIKDKPRKHNPMLDDEAEESDVDENEEETELKDEEVDENIEEGDENEEADNEESSEDDSSESDEEEEQATKPKKGRILKAFEDSDDEEASNKQSEIENEVGKDQNKMQTSEKNDNESDFVEPISSSCAIQSSQDDDIQPAQRHQSASDDLFTSQESTKLSLENKEASNEVLGTQTFSISSAQPTVFLDPSQPYDPNLAVTDDIPHNIIDSELPTQTSQSQPIGEDILALCTGKFYDNQFVSQTDLNIDSTEPTHVYLDDNLSRADDNEVSQVTVNADDIENSRNNDNIISNTKTVSTMNEDISEHSIKNKETVSDTNINNENVTDVNEKTKQDGHLKSILDELDDPEFDKPKVNKFFTGATQNKNVVENTQVKKRLIIDSDDETNETAANEGKRKKLKKKKMEKRALQISDDEDEEEEEELEEDGSDVSDMEDNEERMVEYDSEENEIEIKPDKPKKKRKATDFFENEAELTSEDEWVGSGDEDEHGLDRMEREEGDDEVFHQGKLQKELGQIHMRDVMDQDKREVRLLQELLFEDGDLGGGHRQRKFRWRDAGDEETGTIPDEFADTQEEEFESEEQWRKQRHEREVFLRQLQNHGEEESLNVTVNRNTIIKANLSSKTMSTLLMEVNQTKVETVGSPVVTEKKPVKNVPSPKKSFTILQQNYHNSLLTRGRGALARLAALATPLAGDDDAPKITSLAPHKRNFVFAAITPDEEQPKVTIKRKADTGTPKLVKKMRIEEKNQSKSSLFDHLNV